MVASSSSESSVPSPAWLRVSFSQSLRPTVSKGGRERAWKAHQAKAEAGGESGWQLHPNPREGWGRPD